MAGETPAMKGALDEAKKADSGDAWPRDENGVPMIKIQAAAAELVPTVQYGNVTVGPVMVTRFVPDGDADHVKAWIKHNQELVELAVAEDRKTVHDLMRSRAAA
jgi:hypothetical protein